MRSRAPVGFRVAPPRHVERLRETLKSTPMHASSITTDRLILIPATPAVIHEALRGDAALARALDASLPVD